MQSSGRSRLPIGPLAREVPRRSLRPRKILVLTAMVMAPVALMAFAVGHGMAPAALRVTAPDMVELRPGAFRYRAAGEFMRGGTPVTAPMVTVTIKRPLAVMRHQVTAADYQRCVEAKACPVVDQDAASGDLPVVNVNWWDAQAYASWLSRETGARFRLPTDEEWVYAAGGRFKDDALPEISGVSDPGLRALVIYDLGTNREVSAKAPQPIGSFGANENGLLDVAGNVWEWTDTCFVRNTLDARDEVAATMVNCGVRVVEGLHRTYMTDFIRDARTGGCSVAPPPSNLGFRLVRDGDPWRSLLGQAQRLVGLRS
jgi:formylglycine-generating enzyme required for sulfatase activity